jgi:hypothetical protein
VFFEFDSEYGSKLRATANGLIFLMRQSRLRCPLADKGTRHEFMGLQAHRGGLMARTREGLSGQAKRCQRRCSTSISCISGKLRTFKARSHKIAIRARPISLQLETGHVV